MITTIRSIVPKILVVGAHQKIIQSILDFDYIAGRSVPSITAVVGGTRKSHKCFFGDTELLLPVYQNIPAAAEAGVEANALLNIASANSARVITELFFAAFPEATTAHLFAEGVAERDALALIEQFGEERLIAGASGVGLLVPGSLKLGAAGGIFGGNINRFARLSGNTAIICSSGGMVNELIDTVVRASGMPSFAVSYGGDRFPISAPVRWCLEAESDPETDQIIFFGELGGFDEYEIAAAVQDGRITKPIHAYIAGRYQGGEEKVQFGHAKALAETPEEDADSKMAALQAAGASVYPSYRDFVSAVRALSHTVKEVATARAWQAPEIFRNPSMFTAVADRGKSEDPFVRHALSTLLERDEVSNALTEFTEAAYSLLVDHGAQPSGAVNTMITARAGRDMGASLASGILTVGDRFGGAINGAARNWFQSVQASVPVETMLEDHKKRAAYVLGIGHRKYNIHNPDPRVAALIASARKHLKTAAYLDYAEAVAARTTEKRPNLILNVDGVIAAAVLDILSEVERYSKTEIAELIDIEFFNSYFIIPRTVGFVGNYLSQKRRDEGLFRLPDSDVFYE